MKKFSLILFISTVITACSTLDEEKGNATILSIQYLPDNQVELVVQKDNGELAVLLREYDEHDIAMGKRIDVEEVEETEQTIESNEEPALNLLPGEEAK
ncbi:hypothetical protein [Muribacter muris]|uniref:hypothetical protein n=1 Tax=Muribacter muris TaxID=67855 RepID=UPI00064D8986|nr:hypothetical protein [Muribacter muris]